MALWFSCLIAMTMVFVPAAVALDSNIVSFPVWLTLVVFAGLVFKLVFFRLRDFLYASFLCFFYIFMILAPLLQLSEGTFPWIDFYNPHNIETAWWITAIALMFFEFGYIVFYLTPTSKRIEQWEPGQFSGISNSGGRLLFAGALLFTLFGLAFTGVDTLFLPRNQASMLLSDKVGSLSPVRLIINSLMRVPPAIVLLIFIYDFYKRLLIKDNRRWLTPNTIYMVLIGLIVAVVNNPISTARFWVGAIAFSVLLIFIYARRKNSAFFWMVLNLSVVLLVFPISDLYRKSLDFNILEDDLDLKPTEELVTSPDFDAFQQQINVTIVTEETGFRYGNQFLSSMFFFVPRVFWPGKSDPTGRYIATELNYRFDNLSTPLMSEFYVDGGFIGVVIGMFLFGMLYRYLYMLSLHRTILAATFYCFFASYQFYLLRGSLMTVTNYLFVALLTIYGIHIFRRLIFSNAVLATQSTSFYSRVYP